MRLNRYLAAAGLGSRRTCESLITDGRVSINGKVVDSLATVVGPGEIVKVDGQAIKAESSLTLIINKPKGAVCSTEPQGAPRTVFDYLPKNLPRLFYVGRLDADSEGLLVMTNQGELAQRLTHPSFKLPKTYRVKLDKPLEEADARKMEKGFMIEPGFAQAVSCQKLFGTEAEIVLTQGLNRQIRLMFWRLGYNVDRLIRTQIGRLHLGKLRPGQSETLNDEEVKRFLLAPLPQRDDSKSVRPRLHTSDLSRTKPRPSQSRPARGEAAASRSVKKAAGARPGRRRPTAGRSELAAEPRSGRQQHRPASSQHRRTRS